MVVEWIGIHLPVQESLVPSLVQKIPQSNLAPTLHLLSPTHQEPMLHNREATSMRSLRAARKSSPHSSQLEKAHVQQQTHRNHYLISLNGPH